METWKYKAKNSLMYYPEGEWIEPRSRAGRRAQGFVLFPLSQLLKSMYVLACIMDPREVLVHLGVGEHVTLWALRSPRTALFRFCGCGVCLGET